MYLNRMGHHNKVQYFQLPLSLKNPINILISIHILFFVLYCALGYFGFLEYKINDGETIEQFIQSALGLSFYDTSWQYGLLSVFTYQFVHTNFGEIMLSMIALWIFGHMVAKEIGASKVIFLYLICIVLSASVFILSHFVFTVFSGRCVMEGAYPGALAIMTTSLIFYKSFQIRVYKNISIPLWVICAVIILLSFVFVYKNSIAYILVYVCSVHIGYRFAVNKLSSTVFTKNAIQYSNLRGRLN